MAAKPEPTPVAVSPDSVDGLFHKGPAATPAKAYKSAPASKPSKPAKSATSVTSSPVARKATAPAAIAATQQPPSPRPPAISASPATTSNASTTATTAIPALPPDLSCSFVGEGAANVVFSLTVTPSSNSHPSDGSKASCSAVHSPRPAGSTPLPYLLRVPKAAAGVEPDTCARHHEYYVSVLQPLLGAHLLVGQQLVAGVSALHGVLDQHLEALDRSHSRRADWIGHRIAPVDVALLVENMTAVNGATDRAVDGPFPTGPTAASFFTIQFKPKWLAQSPTAPNLARRCRTCAISAASKCAAVQKSTPSKPSKPPKPCPLVLVAASVATSSAAGADSKSLDDALWNYICHHAHMVAPQHKEEDRSSSSSSNHQSSNRESTAASLETARPALLRWLRTTDLFRRLATIQKEYDPHGALSLSPEFESTGRHRGGDDSMPILDRLQTAMTLRDCTCFVQVTVQETNRSKNSAGAAPVSDMSVSVTAKLGDLDRKDGRRKLARWRQIEQELLDGGFYTAPNDDGSCWLPYLAAKVK